MTYAQRCKACKEIFVLPERVGSCPSCAAPMPVKKPKCIADCANKFGNAETVLNSGVPANAFRQMTWQQWKNLEPGLHEDEKFKCIRTGRTSCKAPNNTAGPSTIDGAKMRIPEGTNDVIAEFLTINEEIASLYSLLYGFMSKNTEHIKASRLGGNASMSNETMCDFGFFCREAENTLDELRKEVKARKELCGQTIAIRKTEDSLTDPNIKLKVTGQYATGSPDVKMQAKLPTKFTDEYYQITDYFKVPREVAATGVLRIDWKASGDFITQLAADGHKPPDGFGKQYPTYVTTFRRRRQAK